MPRSMLIAVVGLMLATSLDPGLASPARAQQTSSAPDAAGAPMPKPLPFPDAILVKTPVGKLQMGRIVRALHASAQVFDDERQAIAFLKAGSPPT